MMDCRKACGACCIALSISTPLPGMQRGKPAGVRCLHLTDDLRCAIFGQPGRPDCCAGLRPSEEMCGGTREEALAYLDWLERETRPDSANSGHTMSESAAGLVSAGQDRSRAQDAASR